MRLYSCAIWLYDHVNAEKSYSKITRRKRHITEFSKKEKAEFVYYFPVTPKYSKIFPYPLKEARRPQNPRNCGKGYGSLPPKASPWGERCERCLWQMKRAERVAAVDKIEDQRKPEDFIGHRNRGHPMVSRYLPACQSRGCQRRLAAKLKFELLQKLFSYLFSFKDSLITSLLQ